MFTINGQKWNLEFVNSDDPILTRSDGSQTVGVTVKNNHTIYISDDIRGDFLKTVLTHELCHAYCISYNIYLPIEYEEVFCNLIADYGDNILQMSECILDNLCKYYGKCVK